jgi:hypothetical protein
MSPIGYTREKIMTAVDVAERKARWRAFAFLFLGALTAALMAFNIRSGGSDFSHGIWVGVLAGSAFNLTPIKRWLRPNNAVVRLLDDETTQEYRQLSCTVGFWGSAAAAIILAATTRFHAILSPTEVAEIIATAAIASAMLAFAALELRAAR